MLPPPALLRANVSAASSETAPAIPPIVASIPDEGQEKPSTAPPKRAFNGSADRLKPALPATGRTPSTAAAAANDAPLADRITEVSKEAQLQSEVQPGLSTRPPEPALPPPSPHVVTIPKGTLLTVRLNETVSTEYAQPGDTFSATLDRPLVAGGFVIAERGSRVTGKVVESELAGRVRGVSRLGLELSELSTSDGQRVRVNTASFERRGESSKVTDMAKVGIGSVLGAAIGAIAGGVKGAGLGAGLGGAAGAGDVLLTRGRHASIPVETRLRFALSSPITLTEQFR